MLAFGQIAWGNFARKWPSQNRDAAPKRDNSLAVGTLVRHLGPRRPTDDRNGYELVGFGICDAKSEVGLAPDISSPASKSAYSLWTYRRFTLCVVPDGYEFA